MSIYRQIKRQIGKLARRAGLRPHKAPPPNYIDSPIIRVESGEIPIDDYVVMSPNYAPAVDIDEPEEVPLGAVTVTGQYGRILQRNIWLMEFSWYGGTTYMPPSHRHEPLNEQFLTEPDERLEGRVTSTVATWSGVYGHVLLDELPLLLYLLDTRKFIDFDHILVSPLGAKLLRRVEHASLEALTQRLVPVERGKRYSSSNFVAYRRTGCQKNPSKQELEILRRLCLTEKADTHDDCYDKIFLERSNQKRSITNFDEIKEVLNHHNITIVRGGDLPNSWQTFARARLVIGVAGSDISDSCFMAKPSHLLEIHPTDHVYAYNWNVAKTIGFNYHGMLEKSEIERGVPIKSGLSPLRIDPARLGDRITRIMKVL